MSVVDFPVAKSYEKLLRNMDEQYLALNEQAVKLNNLIEQWLEAYVSLAQEYVAAGGSDPEIIAKINLVVSLKKSLGVFVI